MNAKAQAILAAARREAATVETWADLSNFLFDADDGIISKAYPVGPERSEFIKSPEYQAIRQLIGEVQERTGFIEGMTPKRPLVGVDPGWKEKLERRLAEIRTGLADGIPAAELFAKIREKYS